jgi:signal transduction histidine kinase
MERKINKSNDVREETMKQNLLYLGLAWFISILLSLYLSMIIYKQIRSYEEQINQSNDKMMFQSKQALIGELFSMIAHQWRQPINKIASIVALIRFELENDKISKTEIDNSCEEIEDSIEFMSETIDDFRTFYKPTTSTKLVNLKTLITRSIFFLKSSIQKNDIKIIKQLEDIEIELYRNEFLQVMLNLIKNAIDAVGSQGVVIIKLYKEVDKVIISVENSGKSIDKEVMKKIFEPYFTTKDESMGLGLYMTKIIVEKHMKGEIMVERLKDGTKFTIML